eukprot:1019529-Pelagomonas_calceolata.AAC.4
MKSIRRRGVRGPQDVIDEEEQEEGVQGLQDTTDDMQGNDKKRKSREEDGNVVSMDIAFRTNLWGSLMLRIAAVDNHGYGYPVASAFVQSERQKQFADVIET